MAYCLMIGDETAGYLYFSPARVGEHSVVSIFHGLVNIRAVLLPFHILLSCSLHSRVEHLLHCHS
jgi:hypothetical protein